jgi:hypothetical protein
MRQECASCDMSELTVAGVRSRRSQKICEGNRRGPRVCVIIVCDVKRMDGRTDSRMDIHGISVLVPSYAWRSWLVKVEKIVGTP